MYKIILNSQVIELDESAIQVNLFNNAFSDNVFQGDYSWRFSIHLTKKNKRIFNFVNLLAIKSNTPKFKVQIVSNGTTQNAELVLISSNREKISANLKVNLNTEDTLQKKLQELSWYFGFTADLENNAEAYLNASYPDKFCLPGMINQSYYDPEDRPDFEGTMNKFDLNTGQYIRNYKTPTFDAMNINALVPQPFLLWMLEVGFADMGYTIKGDFVNHPDIKKTFIYQNFEAASGTNHQSTGSYTAQQQVNCNATDIIEISGSSGGRFNPSNNRYESQEKGAYKFNLRFTVASVVTVANVVEIVAKDNLGQSTKYKFWNAYALPPGDYTVPLEIVLDNGGWAEFYIDSLNGTGVINLTNLYIDSEMKGATILNKYGLLAGLQGVGLPAITFGEFINAVKLRFNLIIKPNFLENTITIDFAKDILSLIPKKELKSIKNNPKKTLEKPGYQIINKIDDLEYISAIYTEEYREKVAVEYTGTKQYNIEEKLKDLKEINLNLNPLLDTQQPPEGFYSCIELLNRGGSSMLNQESTPDLFFGYYQYSAGNMPIATAKIQTEFGGYNSTRPFIDIINWYEKQVVATKIDVTFYLNREEYKAFNIYEPYFINGVSLHMIEIKFQKVKDYYIATAKAIQF